MHCFLAPAKLNLMLRVVGRRADGYHLLQTVFRFIDWADTLRIRVTARVPVAQVAWNVVDDFAESSRGAGGFGSTGKH